MKNRFIISAMVLTIAFSACNNSSTKNEKSNGTDASKKQDVNAAQIYNMDTATLKSGDSFYQCSMDLEVISNKPGSCPKCNMALEKVVKK